MSIDQDSSNEDIIQDSRRFVRPSITDRKARACWFCKGKGFEECPCEVCGKLKEAPDDRP